MGKDNLRSVKFEVVHLVRDTTIRARELYSKEKFTLKTLEGCLKRNEREGLNVITIIKVKVPKYDSNAAEVLERYQLSEYGINEIDYKIDHRSGKFYIEKK